MNLKRKQKNKKIDRIIWRVVPREALSLGANKAELLKNSINKEILGYFYMFVAQLMQICSSHKLST